MAQCKAHVALMASKSVFRGTLAAYVLVMSYGHLTLLTGRNRMSAMDIAN